jgi:hypothetical protein
LDTKPRLVQQPAKKSKFESTIGKLIALIGFQWNRKIHITHAHGTGIQEPLEGTVF